MSMTNELYLFFQFTAAICWTRVTTCRDRPLTALAFVFQKSWKDSHTRSDIAMIKFLKLCILLRIRTVDLINDIKITAELNEWYLCINGPKKHENVKRHGRNKNIKNVCYIYARSYQCSEWSSIVYNTQMTDVTGLENGSFSYVVTNQVDVVAVESQNCYQWQTS